MAITRGSATRKRVSESPPSSPPPTKLRAISYEPLPKGVEATVDPEGFVDVEAEYDPESDGHSSDSAEQGAAAEDDEDSSNEWVVADDDVISIHGSDSDASDTLSDDGEFLPTLTGPKERSASLEVHTGDLVHLGAIDVKGKSVAIPVTVKDDLDARMTGNSDDHVDGDVDEHDAHNQGAVCADGGDIGTSGEVAMNDVVQDAVDDMPMIISRAGSLSLAVSEEGAGSNQDGNPVADIFSAVKDKRPVKAKATTATEKHAKDKGSTGDKKKKPEPKQSQLEVNNVGPELAPSERFALEDGRLVRGRFLRRLSIFTTFANDEESMFYATNEPRNLEWSTGKVNVSRLIVKGQATPVRLMVLGQVTWNGMLPLGRNDDGPEYPTRPKTFPIRARNTLELQNMSTLSAHTEVGERQRGSDKVVGVPFSKIYNADKKYSANKAGMEVLRPNQLIRGDVVMLEVSVGRYYDMVGKQPNWSSTRVYFRLEAVSLLRARDALEESDDHQKPGPSSKPKRRVPMDVSM